MQRPAGIPCDHHSINREGVPRDDLASAVQQPSAHALSFRTLLDLKLSKGDLSDQAEIGGTA